MGLGFGGLLLAFLLVGLLVLWNNIENLDIIVLFLGTLGPLGFLITGALWGQSELHFLQFQIDFTLIDIVKFLGIFIEIARFPSIGSISARYLRLFLSFIIFQFFLNVYFDTLFAFLIFKHFGIKEIFDINFGVWTR